MQDNTKVQTIFFFLIFAFVGMTVFWVYRPFLEIIFLSVIFAVILQPLFKFFLRFTKNNRGVSAFITLAFAVMFILVPLYFLGAQILAETTGFYNSISGGESAGSYISKVSVSVDAAMNNIFPMSSFSFQTYVYNVVSIIQQNIGTLVSSTAFVFLGVILVLLSIFFFLKDGPFFMDGFLKLSPLDDKYDKNIIETFNKTIKSVIVGAFTVEVIQGLVLMLNFSLFGIPNAFLWGSVAVVFAVIPGIGIMAIFIPAVLYLFYINNALLAIGLLSWSILVHGSIDNFLAPKLYGRGISVHPIFIMFSILGGILFFGPLGFLFGPLVLSVFIALFHIYRLFILKEEDEQ